MTTAYTHEGLTAEIEDNEAVVITMYGIQRIELTVDELLAIADAVRAKMECRHPCKYTPHRQCGRTSRHAAWCPSG